MSANDIYSLILRYMAVNEGQVFNQIKITEGNE